MWNISQQRSYWVNVNQYDGRTKIHIRHYFREPADGGDGALRPSTKGIALNEEEWNQLKQLVPAIDRAVEEARQRPMSSAGAARGDAASGLGWSRGPSHQSAGLQQGY